MWVVQEALWCRVWVGLEPAWQALMQFRSVHALKVKALNPFAQCASPWSAQLGCYIQTWKVLPNLARRVQGQMSGSKHHHGAYGLLYVK